VRFYDTAPRQAGPSLAGRYSTSDAKVYKASDFSPEEPSGRNMEQYCMLRERTVTRNAREGASRLFGLSTASTPDQHHPRKRGDMATAARATSSPDPSSEASDSIQLQPYTDAAGVRFVSPELAHVRSFVAG
jgi:hypothetical protein